MGGAGDSKDENAGRYAVVVRPTEPAETPPAATSGSDDEKTIKNRYVLLRKLGEGSQGETYEAIDKGGAAPLKKDDRSLADQWQRYVRAASGTKSAGERPPPPANARLVAIKCFRVNKAKVWKDVELAEREARTLQELDHPRLPRYIEHFEEDGALYLVMEKIEGESLAALRESKRRTWTADEIQRMLEDIADALRYLHARTPFIVHRDIKPGNIIRRPDGSFALVDFGAVRDRLKLQGGSTIVGTFGFMAPEQFQGRASPKSDVYGVGATAMWMLTGEEPEDLPHEGLGIDVQRAVPKGTPPALVRALNAMLLPDPDRRIDSVDDALAFLRNGNNDGKSDDNRKKSSRPPTPPTLSRRDLRNQKRDAKREEKKASREERRRIQRLRGSRAIPFLPRLVAQIGILAARIVVGIVVGMAVPLVLGILSMIFGSAMRRAAVACVHASHRANAALGRASAHLGGRRDGDDASLEELAAAEMARVEEAKAAAKTRVRVESELDQIRVLDGSPEANQRRALARLAEEKRNGPPALPGPEADEYLQAELAEAARIREAEREAAEMNARLERMRKQKRREK